MDQIILDASASSKLHSVSRPVELCDPSGKVLGRFTPQTDMSEWELVGPKLTDEELERREKAGGKRHTTAEVKAYLGKL